MVIVVPAWGAAAAQDSSDIRVRVGLGARLGPDYVGADGTTLSPLARINFARGGRPFAFSAPDDSPGIAVARSGGLSFGLAGKIEGRRKESEVGAAVGDIKRTFDAGVFAQYEWRDSFRLRAELLKGVNGHEGLLGAVGADKIWRNGDRYVFSIGPRLLFSDGRYQREYFGVTPAVSVATGLPAYRPGGGLYGVAAASGITYALDDRWGLFGFARYERLVGDAAKSPVVRQFGSRDQMSGGLGLSYTFTVRRGPPAQRP